MKKTGTVDQRTLYAAKRDADKMQILAERVAELVKQAQAIEDKWEWTNWLAPEAEKLTTDESIEFADAIEVIKRTF